jgi:hypothetical protein
VKTPSYNEILVRLLEVQLSLVEAIQNSERILAARGTPASPKPDPAYERMERWFAATGIESL